ncbi:hypothetical protein JCM8208_000408 [Rhodotorula glutinis]
MLMLFAPSAGTAENILANLAGDVYDSSRLQYKPVLVHLIRSSVSQHLARIGPNAPLDMYSSSLDCNDVDYFDELSSMQVTADAVYCAAEFLFCRQAMPVSFADEWFSLMQHKVFIISRLGHLSVHPLAPPGMKELYVGAEERFLEWVKSGMGTGRDDFVRAIEGFKVGPVYVD